MNDSTLSVFNYRSHQEPGGTIFKVMKRLFLLLTCCLLATTSVAYAQISKESKKAIKTNAKQFAKEGWTLDGTGTFTSVLTTHFEKLSTGTAVEFVGTSVDKRSINLGKATARNNAINEYAEYARSMVRARINTDLIDLNEEQRENFVAGYERLVIKELNGEITPSFFLYRRNSDGTYETRGFFIVDEAAAAKANKKALEDAAEEMGLARNYADKVSDFVNDGFKNLKQ